MLQAVRTITKSVPGVQDVLDSEVWKRVRFRLLLLWGRRRSVCHTRFHRLSAQLETVCQYVLPLLLEGFAAERLSILVVGCSNGAEPYTIASFLKKHLPRCRFRITAIDIDPAAIAKAKSGCYSHDEVSRGLPLPDEFMRTTFERCDSEEGYRVARELRESVDFRVIDVLDWPAVAALPTADILVAQNILYHLKPRAARKAFRHLLRKVNDRSVLLLDGMDLAMRARLTKRSGLVPVERGIERIHRQAYIERGPSWPWIYWGLEPLRKDIREWKRRYATVFLRGLSTIHD